MLVGRDEPLARVRSALAARHPMVVIGEAGVGKTTLVRAAVEDAGSDPAAVYEGGALGMVPWREYLAFERALGRPVSGRDPAAVAIEVQAGVRDGVLLLEDLHWAAQPTMDVLAMLGKRVRVVATARAGDPATTGVRERLGTAGFAELELGPLASESAAELVRRRRPGLSAQAVASLVRRSGGNPLLLTELGPDGSASGGLRRSVAARLRDLDQPARRAFLLIALAAAPLREEIVEPGALATLRRSGLVIEEEPGRLSPRHALLGELAVAETTDTERALVHALLARVVETDAEAARHHAAAGEVGLAHTAALRAAEDAATPGERAGHLRLAAATAQGDGAEALRLQAAYALADGYEWEAAEEILADIGPDADAEVRARAWLQRARGAWARGAADEIERDIREGLAACAGQDGDTDVLLRIESSRLPLFVRYEFETQIPVTAAHVAEARERGVGIARALYYHGTALAVSGRAEGFEVLAAAVDAATADGDLDTEFTAANNLISFHESDGDPDTGRAFAQRMRDRAHALGLGRWETSMRYQTAQLDFHAGRCSAALAETTDLLGLPLDPRTRDSVREVHGMSLVDVGRIEDADRLAVPWMAEAVDDQQGASQFLWVRAEAALCGGRPADALAHMDEFLRGAEPDPNLAFGWITRAWARWEMGIDPGPHLENPGRRMIDAVEPEGRGIRLLFEGRNSEAAVEFAHAATLWRPYHRRGAVRSAWAHGEALRRAGDLDAAVAALEEAEREAEAFGYAVQAARTRHSLNLSGQRRQASRGRRTGGLTAREADVLELVAEGLTNAQIAGRLGVSVRTVLTQIDSASARIGAVSRAQAAALYRALRAGEPGEAE